MSNSTKHILFATARLNAGGRDAGAYVKLCMDSAQGVVSFRDFCDQSGKAPAGSTHELDFSKSGGWGVLREICAPPNLRVAKLVVHLLPAEEKPWMEIVGQTGDVVVQWHISGAALKEFGDEQYERNFDYLEIDHYEYFAKPTDDRFLAIPRNAHGGTLVTFLQVISGDSKDFDPRPFFER